MPSTNTYYILQFGMCYLTSFAWISSTVDYPAAQFQTDILAAQRMDLDTVTDIYKKLGGTPYKCTETYADGLPDINGNTTDSSTQSASTTVELATDVTDQSANYKAVEK